ncbi:flavin reductase [Sinimarinibacterium sp. NLF-5-8]|nr:flavin reductase [Sinimarinibacterium sp. NLF-5-8]
MHTQTEKSGFIHTPHHPQQDACLSPEQFKAAFRGYPSGVAVITADGGNGPVAMTISSLFSISADPPLLGYSISNLSSTAAVFNTVEHAVIHLVDSSQIGIAKLCATPAADRFGDHSTWSRLATGEPYFSVIGTWLRVRITQRHKAGSATVTIAQAVSASATDEAHEDCPPLIYHARSWHCIGSNTALA